MTHVYTLHCPGLPYSITLVRFTHLHLHCYLVLGCCLRLHFAFVGLPLRSPVTHFTTVGSFAVLPLPHLLWDTRLPHLLDICATFQPVYDVYTIPVTTRYPYLPCCCDLRYYARRDYTLPLRYADYNVLLRLFTPLHYAAPFVRFGCLICRLRVPLYGAVAFNVTDSARCLR